jgi:hypothetical protein
MFSQVWPACWLTVTLAPLCETVPFHELATVCPLAKVQVSDQPESAVVPVLLMVMAAPKLLEF